MSDSLSSDEDAPALAAAAAAAVGLVVSVLPRSRLYDARPEPLYIAGEFGPSFLAPATEDDGDRDAASVALLGRCVDASMRDESAALPVIGADLTLSGGFFRDGSLPLRLDGAYANETRDPPGCDEQEVRS